MTYNSIFDQTRRPSRCIVLAIDGARGDYLEKYEAPWMQKLADEGVGFRNAIASNGIAETASGFATIGTGLTTREHGVIGSREWYDREKKELVYVYNWETNELHLDAPTVAQQMKSHLPDLKVASISAKDRLALLMVGASADVVAFSYREHVFHRHLKGAFSGRGVSAEAFKYTERTGYNLPSYLQKIQVSRRIRWCGPGFDHALQQTGDTALIDKFIMDGALAIVENFKPDILYVGLVAANIVGHKYGPESPEMKETFRFLDEQIGRLLAKTEDLGIRQDILFIVVSDHGMTMRPQGIDIVAELQERFGSDLCRNILYIFDGSTGGIYLKNPQPVAIERMVMAVRQVPHVKGAWWKYDPQAPWFVMRTAHPHTPDVLIFPERNRVILGQGVKYPNVVAHHGTPYPSDLNIVQIYNGPGIKPLGMIGHPLALESNDFLTDEEVRGLPEHADVAPLMRHLFGLPQ
jgi:hypothetical protein